MEALSSVLAFLQSTLGKSAVVYGFGWLFKLNPKFKDEGIPIGTLVVNILLAVITLATEAGGVKPAVYALAVAGPLAVGGNIILDILIPQIIADGAYNWPKKVWSWLQGRFKK